MNVNRQSLRLSHRPKHIEKLIWVGPVSNPLISRYRRSIHNCPTHSADLCDPSSIKFPLSNHRSNRTFASGHSESSIEYHAVSRFSPLIIMCWRNTPSNVNPNRPAARFDFSFAALHFHSYRRYPSPSNTYRANKYIASVAPRVRCNAPVNKICPTSITRCFGSIRINEAVPIARPDSRSNMAKCSGSSLSSCNRTNA